MEKWENKCPIVIVPTKYYETPTETFEKLGINMVVWANHNMRSAIKSMEETSKNIFENKNLMGIEKEITTVKEIFEYTKEDDLKADELLYAKK